MNDKESNPCVSCGAELMPQVHRSYHQKPIQVCPHCEAEQPLDPDAVSPMGKPFGESPRTNQDLHEVYEKAHADPSFWTVGTEETTEAVLNEMDWDGLTVLEIGCGTGLTSYGVAQAGAYPVDAYDYSEEAIRIAEAAVQPRGAVRFHVGSAPEVAEGCEPPTYDVVIAQEVIEHTDDPLQSLKDWAAFLKPGGTMIITCPSFLNPRGIVWQTLRMLLDVPVSPTDLHYINIWDMVQWAREAGLIMGSMRTVRHDQGWGDLMQTDLRVRLNNALADWIGFNEEGWFPGTHPDDGMKTYKRDDFHPAVDRFLTWLRQANDFMEPKSDVTTGVCSIYTMRRPS